MRRMDRYKDEEVKHQSRTEKNQELYRNVSNNVVYTNITDVTNANAFEINPSQINDPKKTTRESYQQMQKYQNVEPTPRVKKELEDFNYLYKGKENKVYDINSVLEEARKNRDEQDEKESKRKLKNKAYNILADINKGELEKYREEKRKRILTPEEDEIRELIDTIASKTLAGEIDKATSVNLLSDLMATSSFDKVDGSEEIETEKTVKIEKKTEDEDDKTKQTTEESITITKTTQIENTEEKEETEEIEETGPLKGKDPDFYTRSMDLSDKDFNMSDDFSEKKLPFIFKFLIFILIISIIGLTVFYIYQKMH